MSSCSTHHLLMCVDINMILMLLSLLSLKQRKACKHSDAMTELLFEDCK